MAILSNTFQTFAAIGNREDLANKIYMISPTETPVMANILMINLFFHIAAGAEFMAVFLFVSMILLLWREHEAILNLFWKEQHAEAPASRRFHRSMAALVIVIIIVQMVFAWWMERR